MQAQLIIRKDNKFIKQPNKPRQQANDKNIIDKEEWNCLNSMIQLQLYNIFLSIIQSID